MSNRKKTIIVLILLAIGIIWFAVRSYYHNPAEERANPIENELISHGGEKECTSGDPGRGPDNLSPWYEARLQFNKGKEETLKIVKEVLENHEYRNLSQVSSEHYPSILTISDNKNAVQTSVAIYTNSVEKALHCLDSGKALKADANHTAVSLSLSLPRR